MKLYVVVEVYQLIVSGVYVTEDEEDAEKHFKEYTEIDFSDYKKSLETGTSSELLGDYDQTNIFVHDSLKGIIEL